MAVLERSASKSKVESLLRCQEISDATVFRHGKRNFRRRGQWTTFRDGGMRHQGSRRKTVLFPTSDRDALPILRGDVSALLCHRRLFRNHRRSHTRTRTTIRTLRKTSSSVHRRHASSTEVDSHAVT